MQVLDIYGQHQPHALKKELTEVFAGAAAVCMQRFDTSPRVWSLQSDQDQSVEYEIPWREPSDADRRTYNNDDEATELGACAVALAAADIHLQLVAYARAEPRTGVDFYLCLPGNREVTGIVSYDLDHRDVVGLEVSGISEDSDAKMNARIRRKIAQIRSDKSPDRAIAGVVGFQSARIIFRTAKP
jgi:hypothetical protein